MRVLLAVLVCGTVAFAQAPAAPATSRTMVSAAEVAAMMAKAKAERKDQPSSRSRCCSSHRTTSASSTAPQ